MQAQNENPEIKVNRRSTRSSTTLSRRYTKRPQMGNEVKVKIKKSPEISHFAAEKSSVATPLVSGKEMKEKAIKKALASASTIDSKKDKKNKVDKFQKVNFGMGRILLALSCAAAAVAAIVYFVNLNMPDISMQVAAMQNGINPTYPSYVPKDYKVSGIVSAEGQISINFTNESAGKEFSLIEEKSSWNTDALLNNFVKPEYGEDYTIVREQGLTIYISESNAAWVNGGNVYKIAANNDTLTNKQIRSIAASL